MNMTATGFLNNVIEINTWYELVFWLAVLGLIGFCAWLVGR